MIFCCGIYQKPTRVIFPADTEIFSQRKLEILICPKCGSLIAELVQFNRNKNDFELIRPKRKKTFQFINSIESGDWNENDIKYGSKTNAAFVYGLNLVTSDGTIKQFAVDFNGVRRLVKVVKPA